MDTSNGEQSSVGTCHLTQLKLKQPCPVTSCMWWGKVGRMNCLYGYLRLGDQALLSRSKGIPQDQLELRTRQALLRIERSLILDRFKHTLTVTTWLSYAPLNRYDLERVDRVLCKPQFKIDPEWSIEQLLSACSYKEWSEFTNKSKRFDKSLHSHRRVLGLSKQEFQYLKSIIQHLKSANRRRHGYEQVYHGA